MRLCNACVDGMDCGLVGVEVVIVMAEKMAEQGC